MTLVPEFTFGSLVLTDAPFSVEFGADLGNPEDVVTVLNSLLADGEIELTDRTGNRTLQIPLMIDDSDLLALAEAERLLVLECAKARNTLKVDPGDGIAPPTVFDTFRGRVVFNRADEEEQNGVRRYVLTVRALPHGHAVDKIIDTAGTAPSSGTVVNSCDSAAGWSAPTVGTSPPVPTVDTTIKHAGTGSVQIAAYQRTYYTNAYGYARTQWTNDDKVSGLSIATGTGGGYLSVLIRMDQPADPGGDTNDRSRVEQVTMKTSTGATITPTVTASETYSDGFVRYVWHVDAGLTITELSFLTYQVAWDTISGPYPTLHYDAITLSTGATTDQQILKSFNVEGSARTPGSLHIVSPDDAVGLGQVLLITTPTDKVAPGFQPDVRRWVTGGATTTDSTALHGSYYSAASGTTFDVPVSMLTAGPHAIVALMKTGADPLTIGVNAQLLSGSTLTGPVSSASVSRPNSSSAWQLVAIGTVYLPPLPMRNPSATSKVRITFSGGASLADAYMIPDGADFSIVDCGTGATSVTGPSSHLWIDAPSPDQPQGGWWRGPAANRTDARSAWPDAKWPGVHVLEPGPNLAYLVATNAQGPRIEHEYFPACLTNSAI